MKKNTFHFNAVDIILAVFIVVIISTVFSLFLSGNSKIDLEKKQNIQMTVKVYDVPEEMQGKIFQNDVVRLCSDSSEIGIVKAPITYTKAYKIEYDNDGSKKDVFAYPDIQDIKLNIECEAVSADGKYKIGKHYYDVADIVEFYVPGFSGKATITSIEVIK